MIGMFFEAKAFNHPIGLWNVSNVTLIAVMFYNNQIFNQNIKMWDIDKVIDNSDFAKDAILEDIYNPFIP
jgi:hypothetical protein